MKVNNPDASSSMNRVKMAYADRLKPTCSINRGQSSLASAPSPIKSRPSAAARSPTQTRAKAIVKKYRAHVRNQEFKRLKSIVPSVADNDKVSKVRHKPSATKTLILSISNYTIKQRPAPY